jgi:hypothetical protein
MQILRAGGQRDELAGRKSQGEGAGTAGGGILRHVVGLGHSTDGVAEVLAAVTHRDGIGHCHRAGVDVHSVDGHAVDGEVLHGDAVRGVADIDACGVAVIDDAVANGEAVDRADDHRGSCAVGRHRGREEVVD